MMKATQEKRYRSKIGWELWGPVIFLFVFITYQTGGKWQVIAVLLPLAFFLARMVAGTVYTLTDDTLVAKCWPVFHEEISVRSIHRIRNTWNPISSPAASYFGRIELHYGKGRTCIISPRDKHAFIADLLQRNESILTFEVLDWRDKGIEV